MEPHAGSVPRAWRTPRHAAKARMRRGHQSSGNAERRLEGPERASSEGDRAPTDLSGQLVDGRRTPVPGGVAGGHSLDGRRQGHAAQTSPSMACIGLRQDAVIQLVRRLRASSDRRRRACWTSARVRARRATDRAMTRRRGELRLGPRRHDGRVERACSARSCASAGLAARSASAQPRAAPRRCPIRPAQRCLDGGDDLLRRIVEIVGRR